MGFCDKVKGSQSVKVNKSSPDIWLPMAEYKSKGKLDQMIIQGKVVSCPSQKQGQPLGIIT